MNDAPDREIPDLVGVWRLVGGSITDEEGRPHGRPYGPRGTGLLSLSADGRMMAVLVDAGDEAGEGGREYASYCGTYTFDGAMLVTDTYAHSEPRFVEPQVRRVGMEGNRLVLEPPSHLSGGRRMTRRLIWERISTVSL